MRPEDLAQARVDADADLATLAAMTAAEHRALGEWIAAPDPATDGRECDHGAGLADELRVLTDG